MVTFLKPPEFPFIHFSKRNDVVKILEEIIDVYEHNIKVYKDENERLKGIIAELQNAPKKPEIKPSSIEKPIVDSVEKLTIRDVILVLGFVLSFYSRFS